MKPRIRVFTNRIEFFNPGALPKPYEILHKSYISLPRNLLITKIFRVIDLVENARYGFETYPNITIEDLITKSSYLVCKRKYKNDFTVKS